MTTSAAQAGGPIAGPVAEPPALPAAILTADEDLRLLVRGVLTLHHHPILLEGSGPEFLRLLAGTDGPIALVFDVGDGGGTWANDLAALVAARPSLRAVVLLPPGRRDLIERAAASGARATIVRPVALRELVQALDSVRANGDAETSPGLSPPAAGVGFGSRA
jgi:DNA-binding NarL/FixJ family response regulator